MLLITGATGHVGRALVDELDRRGAEFRVLLRTPRIDLPGEHVIGDLGRPETLALEGIDKVFLLAPGIGLEHTENVVAAASAAGVRHLVYLSSYAVLGEPIPAMGHWHHEREQLIQQAGIPATFLRPTGFMTNAFDWLPTIRADGYVLDPIGPGRAAPIDPADIAAVAATVLTEEGHEKQNYTLTGPETFTVAEQVAILSQAIGRDLKIRAVNTPSDAVRFRYPNGAPPALAAALIEGLTLMRADTVGLRTTAVRRLTGSEPRTFADWCREQRRRLQLTSVVFKVAPQYPPWGMVSTAQPPSWPLWWPSSAIGGTRLGSGSGRPARWPGGRDFAPRTGSPPMRCDHRGRRLVRRFRHACRSGSGWRAGTPHSAAD